MSTSNPVLMLVVFLVGYNALLVGVFCLLALIMVLSRSFASRRPPPVAGCGAVTFRLVLQLYWWGLIGVSYRTKRGPWPGRVVSAILLLAMSVLAPALLAGQFCVVARPWARYYFSPAGDAVLAVIGHRGRWVIADHLSSAPGTGQGRALREVLLPVLVAHVDRHQLGRHHHSGSTGPRRAVRHSPTRPARRRTRLPPRPQDAPRPRHHDPAPARGRRTLDGLELQPEGLTSMNHDDLPDGGTPDPTQREGHDARTSASQVSHEETGSHLEDLLAQHLHDVEAEHALLLRMWNTPHPADADSDADHSEAVPEASPGHVTVLHQARTLTASDLRAALIGVPDNQPIAIDVPLEPGGLELHRHVLTAIGGAYLLLADEEEVLDPSFVLRTDYPTGVYEIPDDAPRATGDVGDHSDGAGDAAGGSDAPGSGR